MKRKFASGVHVAQSLILCVVFSKPLYALLSFFFCSCRYQVRVITVFTVFRLLTDFVCLYTYEFWLSLCKIVRSSVILLLPLLSVFWTLHCLSCFELLILITLCYLQTIVVMVNNSPNHQSLHWKGPSTIIFNKILLILIYWELLLDAMSVEFSKHDTLMTISSYG